MKGKTMLVDRKTINISGKTYDDLTDIGRKDETYDDIVARIVKYYKEHAKRDNGR
jgi:hypothetical protein